MSSTVKTEPIDNNDNNNTNGMADGDDEVFNQVMKYRKRLKTETDSQTIRHALKRLHELSPSHKIIVNSKICKIIQMHADDDRNGELARYMLKKWSSAASSSTSNNNIHKPVKPDPDEVPPKQHKQKPVEVKQEIKNEPIEQPNGDHRVEKNNRDDERVRDKHSSKKSRHSEKFEKSVKSEPIEQPTNNNDNEKNGRYADETRPRQSTEKDRRSDSDQQKPEKSSRSGGSEKPIKREIEAESNADEVDGRQSKKAKKRPAESGSTMMSFDEALSQSASQSGSGIKRKKKMVEPQRSTVSHSVKQERSPSPVRAFQLPDLQLPETSAKLDLRKLNAAEQEVERKLHNPVAGGSRVPPKKIVAANIQRRTPASEIETLMAAESFFKPKVTHTVVFAGKRKGGVYKAVPSLYDLCMAVICANIDEIEDTGDVPFEILEPALQRATPAQLHYIEEHNPYLIESTNDLWKVHCNKEFPRARLATHDSSASDSDDNEELWRDLYFRELHAREQKLKSLSQKIGSEMKNQIDPAREAKVIAYAPDPLNVRKKQNKYGTGSRGHVVSDALALSQARRQMMDMSSSDRKKHKPDIVKHELIKGRSADNVKRHEAVNKRSGITKKAPMMQKTMKMFKKQTLRR